MSVKLKTAIAIFVTALVLWSARAHLHFDPAVYSARLADHETHLGIANFWNVITNVGFVFLGGYGLLGMRRFPASYRALAVIFSFAILGTGFGSAYFHYDPTPSTLFWDQLPMSVGFASFVGMIVADRVCERSGLILGLALSVAGPWSVWNIYYGNGETAYYICLQFGALLFALLLLAMTRGTKMRTPLIFAGLFAYIAAKIFETFDSQIYSSLGFISGHSLKHVAATLALWAILRGSREPA